MTQEWFESADLEKKSAQTKSEIQPDQPETAETVETELQASEETPILSKEEEKHEEETPEIIGETQTEEEGEGKEKEGRNQENSVKEKSILSKALESPYIPDIDPRKTARFKEEIALFWTWLLDAIQEPTASKTRDQKHRYSVFAISFADAPIVLVTGSEGKGLARLTRETCDAIASVPIAAELESLNAAVATGIALYQIDRLRARSQ